MVEQPLSHLHTAVIMFMLQVELQHLVERMAIVAMELNRHLRLTMVRLAKVVRLLVHLHIHLQVVAAAGTAAVPLHGDPVAAVVAMSILHPQLPTILLAVC